MDCSNKMLYTLQNRDTLYTLALRYNTTVENIMANNAFLNPYNLIVGSQIVICPNSRDNTRGNISGISLQELNLLEEMNTLWEQHVFWTRLFLISVAESLDDLELTKNRLLRNPKDIASVYRRYYGNDIASRLETLLTEHLVIGGDLIVALKNKNTTLASTLTQKWYQNADEMAEFFSSFNPYYDKEEVRQMFYTHLQLTTDEVTARLRRDFAADIAAFDKIEKEALEMSRYFANRNYKTISEYV